MEIKITNRCGVHNCNNEAVFICKKTKILSCYKCKILYFSLDKIIDIVSLQKTKEHLSEVFNFLKTMKICGSGFHIQANYPDFNKKIEKFERKLNQLESRLVENCSLVEVSIIHDQIVEIK